MFKKGDNVLITPPEGRVWEGEIINIDKVFCEVESMENDTGECVTVTLDRIKLRVDGDREGEDISIQNSYQQLPSWAKSFLDE